LTDAAYAVRERLQFFDLNLHRCRARVAFLPTLPSVALGLSGSLASFGSFGFVLGLSLFMCDMAVPCRMDVPTLVGYWI
jgi:hypothetical protein